MTSTQVSRRRTDPERFDLYTRWSLYLLLAVVPMIGLGIITTPGTRPAAALAFLGGLLVQTGVAIGVTATGLRQFLGGPRVPPGWYVALGVVSAAVAGVAVLGLPPGEQLSGRTAGLLLTLGVTVAALAPVLHTKLLVLATLAVAGLVAGSYVLPGLGGTEPPTGHPFPAAVSTALMIGGVAASFHLSAWTLGVVWEQERNRAVHARLAVAEERLRFARDLHDVVGRSLSAIAVKSELGAELARRGQDGAVDQMLEVRGLAQDTLTEVRSVVAGYRTVDLAAELDGARSVLRAAGVSTRVLGEGTALPEPVQQALAWVVREAVTNVVRHARPGTCTIDLDVVPGPAPGGAQDVARLRIVNDGVAPASGPTTGSGLTGLRERLAAVGGELSTASDGGTFTLTATVPVRAAQPVETGPGRL